MGVDLAKVDLVCNSELCLTSLVPRLSLSWESLGRRLMFDFSDAYIFR